MTDELGFEFSVVSPTRVALRERVVSLIVPGARGAVGFWAGHAPMLVALAPGVVKYRTLGADIAAGGAVSASTVAAEPTAPLGGRGSFRLMSVSGGFFELGPDGRATLLADTAELPEEIDVARAQASYERARRRLRRPTEALDISRAEMALQRAAARLQAAHKPQP